MTEHFNRLTPAQDERLALLSEECGEVIQAIGKIQRHGYHSWNPEVVGTHTNKEDLERELGHVFCAVTMLIKAADLDIDAIEASLYKKEQKVGKYMHHQPPKEAV